MSDATTLDGEQSGAAPASMRVRGGEVMVVIPALNEEEHIEACVRSLMTGDARLKAIEMIVADGGSRDKTREIVLGLQGEFPNLRLLDNPQKLQSAAVNLAAGQAGNEHKILVRCDAHAIYPDNYVMRVADSLVRHGVASLVVPMDAVGTGCFQKANAWIVDTPLGSGGSAHRGGRTSGYVDHGHHAGFDLSTFRAATGYDATFSHNEDAEYDARVRKGGGKIFLDANIRLSYLPRDTIGGLARQYFNYGKGRARTLMKHGERPKLRQLIPPVTLMACVAGLVIAPFSVWGLVLPGGYLAALVAASLMVAVKHKSACGLLAGVASATMHMSWSLGLLRQFLRGQKP